MTVTPFLVYIKLCTKSIWYVIIGNRSASKRIILWFLWCIQGTVTICASMLITRNIRIYIIWVSKAGELTYETQVDICHGTFTVLGNTYLCYTLQTIALCVLHDMIILWTVNKDDHIGILLYGTRFSKVRQLRTLAVFARTLLHCT